MDEKRLRKIFACIVFVGVSRQQTKAQQRFSNFLRFAIAMPVVSVAGERVFRYQLIYVHLSGWLFLCLRYVYFVWRLLNESRAQSSQKENDSRGGVFFCLSLGDRRQHHKTKCEPVAGETWRCVSIV